MSKMLKDHYWYSQILTDNKETGTVVIITTVMLNLNTLQLKPTYILKTDTVNYV